MPTGIRSRGPNGKFSIERWVCAPQKASAGTSMAPIESVSMRVSVMGVSRTPLPPGEGGTQAAGLGG